MFTFIDYDRVPWNNNNAEHAIKAFAGLREHVQGNLTQKALDDYLVLLGVCQTCKYQGLDFLDFLRSGENDIEAFALTKQRKRTPEQMAAVDTGTRMAHILCHEESFLSA